MHWNDGCSTARVWTAAALVLLQIHKEHPEVPMDPELFVASQAFDAGVVDAWGDLASPAAGEAYRRRVREIVRRLERELGREVERAERRIRGGRELHQVLCVRDPRLSPLGRYIVARRAGRADLASAFVADVRAQHGSCPLYRSACLAVLPADQYPTIDLRPEADPTLHPAARKMIASLN
jgi:glutathione S-transferase